MSLRGRMLYWTQGGRLSVLLTVAAMVPRRQFIRARPPKTTARMMLQRLLPLASRLRRSLGLRLTDRRQPYTAELFGQFHLPDIVGAIAARGR